jgi:type II secretory pathway component PulC
MKKTLLLTCIVLLNALPSVAQDPIRIEVSASERTRDAIAETVRLNPYIQGGQMRGLQAFGIRAGSLFDRIGLKQQEVIVSVNGEAFPSADIYEAIQSGSVVELQIQSQSGIQRTVVFELVEN